jgi:epoxide hydrolase-like predicted phosphatase
VAEARCGLLVDFGGVLTSDLFASFSAFCVAEGLPADAVRERFRSDREARGLLVALEEGRLPDEEFEARLAALLGVREAGGLVERLMAGVRPDAEMLDAVRAARAAGVRTGLVSNSWGPRTRRYDGALLEELFDGVVISGEIGVRKPAREMYALGAERIGVPPDACVFVDDLPFNLPPAAELGMATVRHRTAEETIPELERLLGVALRP